MITLRSGTICVAELACVSGDRDKVARFDALRSTLMCTLVRELRFCSDWTSVVAPSNCGNPLKPAPTTLFPKGRKGIEGNDLKRGKSGEDDRK